MARADIPWEDRPSGSNVPLWRFSKNPIITRDAIPSSNSIFNSAVVRHEDGFAGVFRSDDRSRAMNIHAGRSIDGVKWELEPDPISWIPGDDRVEELGGWVYGYDPRAVWIEDRYYVTWCNGYKGYPTIGVGYTADFEDFYQLENAYLPFNRNGVLFPRKINGSYVMLSRPSDNGHTPFGDVFLSESRDFVHWGRHRHVMSSTWGWQSTKIGAGPIPIETPEGWLLIYHGVLTSCNGFVYSMGSALLDLEQPWKVLARGRDYLIAPQTPYECVGDVPNVAFPCASVVADDGDRIAVYYGAADTVVALAFGRISELVEWTKANSTV